jgi:hypothetical protein
MFLSSTRDTSLTRLREYNKLWKENSSKEAHVYCNCKRVNTKYQVDVIVSYQNPKSNLSCMTGGVTGNGRLYNVIGELSPPGGLAEGKGPWGLRAERSRQGNKDPLCPTPAASAGANPRNADHCRHVWNTRKWASAGIRPEDNSWTI